MRQPPPDSPGRGDEEDDAMNTVLYYPGCGVADQAKSMEKTARAALAELGWEMREMDRWNCCGTVYSLATDDLMRHVGPARVLARAQQAGYDRLLTLCSMCYGTLKRSERFLSDDPERLERVNAFLDDEPDYEGGLHVVHMLELLRDVIGYAAVEERVVRPLEGLKVAPYYGCTLTRPRAVGLDDPERPTALEDLMTALGAEAVSTPERVECCGAFLTASAPDVVRRRVTAIAEAAVDREADLMVTSCPLCQYNLDTRLAEVRGNGGPRIPSLYFTQLLALALGADPAVEKHAIDPLPILKTRGLSVEVEV